MRRSRVPRRLAVTLSATAVAAGLMLAWAAPVSAYTQYWAELSGLEEVPDTGDIDGTGSYRIQLQEDQVCVSWMWYDIETPVAAHIHQGAEGAAGPPVVTLRTPTEDTGDGCEPADPAVIDAIEADPAGYYVNVHTEDYPDGAIRGQLFSVELTLVGFAVTVCPESIQTPEAALAAEPGTCTPTVLAGSDELPPGYTWDGPVLEFDMDVIIEDDYQVLDMSDAHPANGHTCDDATMTCTFGRSYAWSDILVGPTSVRQFSFPDGYRFGWATVKSIDEGADPLDATVDVDAASIAFDTTEADNDVFVRIYDFVGEAEEEPTAFPSITPPATWTAPTAMAASSNGAAAIVAVLGLLVSISLALVARGRRSI